MNNKFKYLLVNFHDNDFYIPMCTLAEILITMFCDGILNISEKDKITVAIPKLMATLVYLNSKNPSYDQYFKYFSNKTTILFDIDEIVNHIMKYDMGSNLEISGLYNEECRTKNPIYWFNSLDINLNAECILIQFVFNEDGTTNNSETTYRYF